MTFSKILPKRNPNQNNTFISGVGWKFLQALEMSSSIFCLRHPKPLLCKCRYKLSLRWNAQHGFCFCLYCITSATKLQPGLLLSLLDFYHCPFIFSKSPRIPHFLIGFPPRPHIFLSSLLYIISYFVFLNMLC